MAPQTRAAIVPSREDVYRLAACADEQVQGSGDVVQLAAFTGEANRANALLSTGPRTPEGKARGARNAMTHGLTSWLPVAIARGPFAEDADAVQSFVDKVVRGLAPVGVQERTEAFQIRCLVRTAAPVAWTGDGGHDRLNPGFGDRDAGRPG